MPTSTQNPELMKWSETRQSLFEYGNGFRGTIWWSGHPGCCSHQTSWCRLIFIPPKMVWRYDSFDPSKILSSPPIACQSRQLMPGTARVLRDGSGDGTTSSGSWRIRWMDLTWSLNTQSLPISHVGRAWSGKTTPFPATPVQIQLHAAQQILKLLPLLQLLQLLSLLAGS